MPGANSSALGLSSQPQNTAGMNLHQIERCPVSLEKQQQMKSMNLAMKHQGRGFALGLQMESFGLENRPKAPGRNFRTLGSEVISGRNEQISITDYLGETEGVENFLTHQYPM